MEAAQWAEWLLQTGIAFIAVLSFAVLFNAPREQYVWAGLTGAVAWLVYVLVMNWNPSLWLASFLSTMVLTILSRLFAIWRRTPITVFLICGIFPLVPGAGIYYTAYYLIMGDMEMAGAKGMETLKIAVAIALGIVVVLSLPQKFFIWRRRTVKEEKK